MELTLSLEANGQVAVTCDGSHSHRFALSLTTPGRGDPPLPQPIADPQTYGSALFETLFPSGAATRQVLDRNPARIVLVATDAPVQAVPWEYLHGPDGYLVLDHHFVRGLPPAQRREPPTLDGGLHIVAVPSQPLDADMTPLDIEGEWTRLAETVAAVGDESGMAIALERVRPPTAAQLRNLLTNRRNRVVHFMGHGGHDPESGEAALIFEAEGGAPKADRARDLARRLRGTAYLATLNACVSAAPSSGHSRTPGATDFSNLAALLVQRGLPYALGMRLSIADEDARAFARTFYGELARGAPVEEAGSLGMSVVIDIIGRIQGTDGPKRRYPSKSRKRR